MDDGCSEWQLAFGLAQLDLERKKAAKKRASTDVEDLIRSTQSGVDSIEVEPCHEVVDDDELLLGPEARMSRQIAGADENKFSRKQSLRQFPVTVLRSFTSLR